MISRVALLYLLLINKYCENKQKVGVPEWLSGMTRNHVGFARAGSNPAAHEIFIKPFIYAFLVFSFYIFIKLSHYLNYYIYIFF